MLASFIASTARPATWFGKSGYPNCPASAAIARATPAIAGNLLIFGTQGGPVIFKDGVPVVAVDKCTGALAWTTKIEEQA